MTLKSAAGLQRRAAVAAQRPRREQRQKRPRKKAGGEGHEVVPHGILVALVAHGAQQAAYVLLHHQAVELLAALQIGLVGPPCRQYHGHGGKPEHLEQRGEEAAPAQKHVHAHNEARQQSPHRPLGECGAGEEHGHKHPPPEAEAKALVLDEALHLVHRNHHARREHHVEAAGHGGAEHLDVGQHQKGEEHRETHRARARRPAVGAHCHGHGGKRRRQTRDELVHLPAVENLGENGYEPCQERGLEGDVDTIVHRQYPVAAVKYRHRHDGLAGLTLGVEQRLAEPRHKKHGGGDKHHHGRAR